MLPCVLQTCKPTISCPNWTASCLKCSGNFFHRLCTINPNFPKTSWDVISEIYVRNCQDISLGTHAELTQGENTSEYLPSPTPPYSNMLIQGGNWEVLPSPPPLPTTTNPSRVIQMIPGARIIGLGSQRRSISVCHCLVTSKTFREEFYNTGLLSGSVAGIPGPFRITLDLFWISAVSRTVWFMDILHNCLFFFTHLHLGSFNFRMLEPFSQGL